MTTKKQTTKKKAAPKKAAPKKATPVRTSHDELAREASEWDARTRTPEGFRDAPEAVPNAGASQSICLRVPRALLEILRRFAERQGVGYQVLIKRWLDDRIRLERDRMVERRRDGGEPSAPAFPLEDRPRRERGHYRSVG